MKLLTISELELLAEDLRTVVGGQVQKVTGTRSEFGLGLYKNGNLLCLWAALDRRVPGLFLLEAFPAHKKVTTPLLLFLNAHFSDCILTAVEVKSEYGRVLVLTFNQDCLIEVRLFTKGLNFIAQSGRSRVSWAKIQELKPTEAESTSVSESNSVVRTPGEFYQEWVKFINPKMEKKGNGQDVNEWRKKERLKIEKSLAKLYLDLDQKNKSLWRQTGEWLRLNGSLNVPSEFGEYLDRSQKLAWNIENCFVRAKDNEAKIVRTKIRAEELQRALVELAEKVPMESTPALKEKERIPKRTLRLNDDVAAEFGKSATDNLNLLRQARPWQLWLHFKDYPSAHCIVKFAKGYRVSDEDLKRVSTWLWHETVGKRKALAGTFEVLIAECRFVTPIKGDSIGRVNYRNERVLRLKLD